MPASRSPVVTLARRPPSPGRRRRVTGGDQAGGEARQAGGQPVGVQVVEQRLANRGDAADRLLQGALADGGDGQVGVRTASARSSGRYTLIFGMAQL
jgi:hypothetical protein